jgi:glycoside/pentoside/hexuronide:cation symporter, GPH family
MGVNGPLSFNTKLAYGVGQAAEGIKNTAMATFLMFYYNQVLGMPPAWVALAIGTAVIVDAITDPLAGSISDYWRSGWGRRHPFMLASAVPLAISFFFLFFPLVEGNTALFIWLVIFANLTRTAMTLYHVPHLALGAEMSNDFDERSAIVAYRMFFTTVGGISVSVIGFTVFFQATDEYTRGQLNPDAYTPFAVFFAVVMMITILWSVFGTRSVIPFLPQPTDTTRMTLATVLRRLVDDVRTALSNRSFAWLFSGVLVIYVMVGVDTALNLYMNTYFWALSSAQIAFLAPAYAIGLLAGSIASPWIIRTIGKRTAVMFGTMSWGGWQIIPVALRLMEVLPENGDALLVPILFIMRVIQGACTVQANVAFGSMVADIADENELQSGKRQEGVFFAASSFSNKCASGFGNIGAGIGLWAIGWPEGKDAMPTATNLFDLGILYGPLVAGCAVISVWCYSHHRLTREQHQLILDELAARRSTATQAPG